MKATRFHWTSLTFLCVLFISLSSCDRTRNQKGYEYFPDMAHSYAYETYSSNPFFADGKTMQSPPEGTISRDFIPYQYPATVEGRTRAGLELKNPLAIEEKNLHKGKYLFKIFCIDCHGATGDGNGFLFTSGKYSIQPASLVNERMKMVPEGEIFHVITAGYGIMGAHGPQISPDDRWKLVLYIRNILQENESRQVSPAGDES